MRILQHVKKIKNSQVRQYCVQFLVIVFFFTITNSLTLSPKSFTSHHLLLLQTFSIKTRPPPTLYCTALHLIPLHFASFTSFHFIALRYTPR